MSGLLMKYLFKRNVPDLHFGDDPYFEPEDTRRKKFKATPLGLSKKDTKILKKCRRRAYRLDQSISCCCCSFRFGWSAVIGFIPFIGDIIDGLLAMSIVSAAKSIDGGLPDSVVAQMYANVVVDFGIGLIPFVGDIADMLYKANTRNLQLLEKHLVKKAGQQPGQQALGSSGVGYGEHSATGAGTGIGGGHGGTSSVATTSHAAPVGHQATTTTKPGIGIGTGTGTGAGAGYSSSGTVSGPPGQYPQTSGTIA